MPAEHALAQARFDLHRCFLTWKLVESRLDKSQRWGVGRRLPELHWEWRTGVSLRSPKTRRCQRGQELTTLQQISSYPIIKKRPGRRIDRATIRNRSLTVAAR
jgi:hypothetical protein